MLCPNCKKEIDNDSLFCEHCGEQIKKSKEHSWVPVLLSQLALMVFIVIAWYLSFVLEVLLFLSVMGVIAMCLFCYIARKKNWTQETGNSLVRLLNRYKHFFLATLVAMVVWLFFMVLIGAPDMRITWYYDDYYNDDTYSSDTYYDDTYPADTYY